MATLINLNNTTPAAPGNGQNVLWQSDASSPTNVSAYLVLGGTSNNVQVNSGTALTGDNGFTYSSQIIGGQSLLPFNPTTQTNPFTVTLATHGTAGSTNYLYQVFAKKGAFYIAGSNITKISTGNATLSGSNYIIISWPATPGATSYDVFANERDGSPNSVGLLTNTTSLTFNDTGVTPNPNLGNNPSSISSTANGYACFNNGVFIGNIVESAFASYVTYEAGAFTSSLSNSAPLQIMTTNKSNVALFIQELNQDVTLQSLISGVNPGVEGIGSLVNAVVAQTAGTVQNLDIDVVASYSSGTTPMLRGADFEIALINAGTITTMQGINIRLQPGGGGVIPTMESFHISSPSNTSGLGNATVTTNYGILIEDQHGWGSSNNYGLYIANQGTASTDYALYIVGGRSFFGGKIVGYNNITTVNNGIPSEIAAVDLTAQSAAISTTTLYAVPASGAGQYLLSWNAKVTTAAGVSSTLGALTIVYTDPDGVAQTITCAAQNNSGTIETTDTGNTTTTALHGLSILINAKASTNITYAFAYASNAANAMNYNLHIALESL